MRIFNTGIRQQLCRRACRDAYIVDDKDNIIYENGKPKRCFCHWEAHYLEANVGKSYWDITVDNFDGHPDDLTKTMDYIDNIEKMYETGTGLYIHGGNGSGKTTNSILILKHLIHHSKCTTLFAPFADVVILNSRIVGGFSDKEAQAAIDYIKNIDFLVLDDISKEFDNGKDYARATLNSILRYRDMWNKPTIYTANSPMNDLKRHYGESNFSIMDSRSRILTSEYARDIRKEKKVSIQK